MPSDVIMPPRVFLLECLLLVLLSAVSFIHGHAHHHRPGSAPPPSSAAAETRQCGHSAVGHQYDLFALPPMQPSSTLLEPPHAGRVVHAASSSDNASSANTTAVVWRSFTPEINYTFAESPTKDFVAGSTAGGQEPIYQSCFSGLSHINVGGQRSAAAYCFNPVTGKREYENFCRLNCTADDIATPDDFAALRLVIDRVVSRFHELLRVQYHDGVPHHRIVANGTYQCGGLEFAERLLADSADMALFVTTRPLRHLGSTVAFAAPCSIDAATGRPILGHINVPPATIRTNDDLEAVLLHEITHALGFSPSLYGYLRHPADRTRTYREYDPEAYPTGPLAASNPAAITFSGALNRTLSIDLASVGPGQKLRLVTPAALQVARDFFACPTLSGVELENDGNAQGSTGAHWEMRILQFEYMAAVQSTKMRLSPFTLAFLNDTGFYWADVSAGEGMTWGYQSGCSWVEDTCDRWPQNYFCSGENTRGCGFDYTFVGYCAYSESVAGTGVPAPYQYFPSAVSPTTTGGTSEFLDRCPIYREFSDTPPCTSTDANANRAIGSSPGVSGQCFVSGVHLLDFGEHGSNFPECYKMVCLASSSQEQQPAPTGSPEASLTTSVRIDGSNAVAMALVGAALVPCVDGGILQLRFPPAHAKAASQERFGGSVTALTSYEYAGLFQCGQDVAARCREPERWSLETADTVRLPTITSVFPMRASVAGGTRVTVTGTHLRSGHDCTLHVGGGALSQVVVISDAEFTGVLPDLRRTTASGSAEAGYVGGPNAGGLGNVSVELVCNVSAVCPLGCVVGRLSGAGANGETGEVFVLHEPATEDEDEDTLASLGASNLFEKAKDFFETIPGQIVGGILGGLVLVVLSCILRAICCKKRDKQEEAEEREREAKAQAHQQGLLYMPSVTASNAPPPPPVVYPSSPQQPQQQQQVAHLRALPPPVQL